MIIESTKVARHLLAFKTKQNVFTANNISTLWTGIQVKKLKPFAERMKMLQLSTSGTNNSVVKDDNIVWVDMEMTGLDPDRDHILEVACMVTDRHLNFVDDGLNLVIHQPQQVLQNMNEWSTNQHQVSGLTKRCQESKLSLEEAEKLLLDYVKNQTPFNKCPLGGNSVYMDRFFLKKHMPTFEQHMHYRIIDVSSIKELCSRWYPEVYKQQPNKKELSKHRALEDIKASVDELRHYREKIFRDIKANNQ